MKNRIMKANVVLARAIEHEATIITGRHVCVDFFAYGMGVLHFHFCQEANINFPEFVAIAERLREEIGVQVVSAQRHTLFTCCGEMQPKAVVMAAGIKCHDESLEELWQQHRAQREMHGGENEGLVPERN